MIRYKGMNASKKGIIKKNEKGTNLKASFLILLNLNNSYAV